MTENKMLIEIPPITLEWSNWFPWDDLKEDARRGGIRVPNEKPGVHEVKQTGVEERLTIGRTSNLRMRIKGGLVKGTCPHSTGSRIRANEDTSKLAVRWAITDRPAAVKEELHKRYLRRFGRLPKYAKHT